MDRVTLGKIADSAECRVIGWEEAGNDGHRLTLAALIRAFDNSESALLCEPSLARKTTRPPDLVLIDPEVGVHTFEVKGVTLDQVESLEAGGLLRIRYGGTVRSRNPVAQVRNAMFDVKDATVRAFCGDVRLPFKYWVVFPLVRRAAWAERFGEEAFCPAEFLFADDLDPRALARRLGASDRTRSDEPIRTCPLDQLQCVWRAFGDTSVLYCRPEDREQRRASEGTLGEQFDEAAEAYKALSDEQQRLSAMDWAGGPRLVRGVAGSGKTVVLANNLARRLDRMLTAHSEGLPDAGSPPPRLLAVCYNRTLAPLIKKKIDTAYEQRTGQPVPKDTVDVCSMNSLVWRLRDAGLWRYRNVGDASDVARARQYLGDLERAKADRPDRVSAVAYDAVYVDEGQDILEDEFRLLAGLCRAGEGEEPNLYVFYDDAQNLYGRRRPNWQSLGLNVRGGRAFVMTQCFRNPRPVVEAGLNVLYGVSTAPGADVPTKDFGGLGGLEEKGLIRNDGGFWRVGFAPREGFPPALSLAPGLQQEDEMIVARLRWLLGEQEVRPEDVMVLTHSQQRARRLADVATAAGLPNVEGVHLPFPDKDRALGRPGRLTISTVASAKGYDAYCVLIASANEFPVDVKGRATFYVGCTRAVEHLDVFAYEAAGLARELRDVLERMSTVAAEPADPAKASRPRAVPKQGTP